MLRQLNSYSSVDSKKPLWMV